MPITSPANFLMQVVEPNMDEYQRDLLSLRRAFNVAISLWALKNWVWQGHEADLKAEYGTKRNFEAALHEKCPALAYIRDVANSAKHLKLNPPKTISGIDQVDGGFGPAAGAPLGAMPAIQIREPTGIRFFISDAASVLAMWRDLFKTKRWI